MTSPDTTAIIGLGLMGGSLARDLAARGVRIAAFDADPDVVLAASAAGIVAEPLDDSLSGIGRAGLIVIATPVDAAIDTLARMAPHLADDAIVTDMGSVKQGIADRAGELGIGARFVGSHPLTGDHRSGWSVSRASLFTGVPVFVCPTPATEPAALARVSALWTDLGAHVEEMDAETHDRRMAWLSHLPQIASSVLALALRESDLSATDLGPGGRDATRLAASSAEMWSAIALANADHISRAIEGLHSALDAFAHALHERDRAAMLRLFQAARDWREKKGEE